MPRRSSQRNWALRALASLGLALLFHGVALVGAAFWSEAHPPLALNAVHSAEAAPSSDPDVPIEIESLASELDKPQEQTEREKEAKKEEERKDAHGQVVDIAKPTLEQRPDAARFLAEYDSKVAQETKGATGDKKAGAPVPIAPSMPPSPPTPPAPQDKPRPLALRGPTGDRLPNAPAGLQPEDVRELGPDGEYAHQMGEGPLKPQQRPGGASPPPGALPNLNPSAQQLQRALGMGAGSPDYLEDVDDGDSTALNAKKWIGAEFFNRVKQAVRDEWHPDEILGRHDPSGRIYGTQDRTTMLKVQLRPDGRIEDVKVVRRSGVDSLDDEAMSAFRRAQPFANPPAALVTADGFIRFNFGFIVNLTGRTSFKFYKYQD